MGCGEQALSSPQTEDLLPVAHAYPGDLGIAQGLLKQRQRYRPGVSGEGCAGPVVTIKIDLADRDE